MHLITTVLLLFTTTLAASFTQAGTVTVAVAANFRPTLQLLATRFEQDSGHRLIISSGASGTLYAQIRHGAPFDVFLSADSERPAQLARQQLTTLGPVSYARGQLVLAGKQLAAQDLAEALKARQGRLAIANPQLAPYGAAAWQVLEAMQLWPLPTGELVTATNIAQATQFVTSGNAELGMLSMSQLQSAGQSLKYIPIPEQLHMPLDQQAVLLKRANNNSAAQAFFHFLTSDAAWQLIATQGYSRPEGT